ncbi:MAG: hypothetical protein Q4A54_13095 [Parabacteroides sp.]|nr:hypothetical protein [Parabacteroides sp.]
MRKNNIELESLNMYIQTAINNISSLETGIHQITTGGPIYHAIVFRYSEGYYSAILSSYGKMDMFPLYIRFDGELSIRSLS